MSPSSPDGNPAQRSALPQIQTFAGSSGRRQRRWRLQEERSPVARSVGALGSGGRSLGAARRRPGAPLAWLAVAYVPYGATASSSPVLRHLRLQGTGMPLSPGSRLLRPPSPPGQERRRRAGTGGGGEPRRPEVGGAGRARRRAQGSKRRGGRARVWRLLQPHDCPTRTRTD